jgi:SAM-dependent methyltransferase
MAKSREINRGYIDFLRVTNTAPTAQTEPQPRLSVLKLRETLHRIFLKSLGVWQFLSLVTLFVVASIVLIFLRLSAWVQRAKMDPLHVEATKNIDLFLEQYPFHLYPILCKSLELAFLRRYVPKDAATSSKIVELAIGDGTLSDKIYPEGTRIVAVDISPFSLRFPASMPHVKRAVVSDCLDPALASGQFDLLVSNNFLHHVSDKERTLDHIARIARKSIFNENTTRWATGWPRPFLQKRMGFSGAAKRTADALATRFLQDLKTQAEVDRLVKERFLVVASEGYLFENTYFLCGIFSRLMGVYGPPSPAYMKNLLHMPVMRRIILATTRALAIALIRFDNYQDKSTAVFVSYSCQSKSFENVSSTSDFICAECGSELSADFHCTTCLAQFPSEDGMTFILPSELQFIYHNFVASNKQVYERESLSQHH